MEHLCSRERSLDWGYCTEYMGISTADKHCYSSGEAVEFGSQTCGASEPIVMHHREVAVGRDYVVLREEFHNN